MTDEQFDTLCGYLNWITLMVVLGAMSSFYSCLNG